MSTDLPINPVLPPEAMGAVSRLTASSGGKAAAGPSTEQAAKDFESILLHQVLEEMKRSVPESGLLDSAATGQAQDLFWFYLAEDLSRKGGLGLWKQVYQQFQSLNPTGREAAVPAAEPRP